MASTPAELLPAYVKAFETLDPTALVPFYHLPCLFLAPGYQGVVAEPAQAQAVVAYLMDQARAQGFRRSEIHDLEVVPLSADLARLTCSYVRFDGEGAEVARFGSTYLARCVAGVWGIAAAVAHDPLTGA